MSSHEHRLAGQVPPLGVLTADQLDALVERAVTRALAAQTRPRPWMGRAEMAAHLSVHPDTVTAMAARGELEVRGENGGRRYRERS